MDVDEIQDEFIRKRIALQNIEDALNETDLFRHDHIALLLKPDGDHVIAATDYHTMTINVTADSVWSMIWDVVNKMYKNWEKGISRC